MPAQEDPSETALAVDAAAVDLELLRTERLARLQAAMAAHGVEACLLFSEPNARYATGVTAMPIWSMSTFTRCAVVPAEGDPILFEHPNSIHRSALRAVDVRPMHGWEFFDDPSGEARVFAREAIAALRERGVRGDRIGMDRLGTPGFLALQGEGLTLVDASPATQEARVIQQDMALVVEIYVGEVGGSVGVKFGDEILVTAGRADVLTPYPSSAQLLA